MLSEPRSLNRSSFCWPLNIVITTPPILSSGFARSDSVATNEVGDSDRSLRAVVAR